MITSPFNSQMTRMMKKTTNNVLVPTPLHNSTSVNVSDRDLFASRRRRLKPEPRLDEEHEVVTIYHPTTSGVKPRLFTSKPLRAFYKSLIGQELSSKVRDILTWKITRETWRSMMIQLYLVSIQCKQDQLQCSCLLKSLSRELEKMRRY